jgi:hypothetical protein
MAGPYRSKDEPGSSQEETRKTDRQMVYRRRTIFKLVGTTKLSPLLTWNTRVWEDYFMVFCSTSSTSSAHLCCSSEIIEQTTEYCKRGDRHQLAYFFFSFRETEKQKASNLPRSILAQLLGQNDNIPTTIQTFYEEHEHGAPSESGVLNSIRDLITKSETYIIIDALDECPNTGDERTELCNILTKMHSWSRERLHILVTSRKETDLLESLLPIVTQESIGIQGSVVDTDIRKFVRTQLQVNSKLSKLSGELQAEIEQALVEKSGGM